MQRPYRIGFFKNYKPYSDTINGDEKNKTGLFYDIWDETKKRYNLQTEEIMIDKPNFNKIFNDLDKNVYDALFIPSFVTQDRIHKANFTRPVMLNKYAIAYKPRKSVFGSFFKILFSTVLPPISILIIIGLTLGYILYLVEPKRGKWRAIFSSIASMFGEMGFISENSSLSWLGMTIAFIIMFISFYFMIFLQAATVDKFSETVNSYEITKDTLQGKRILTIKGSTYVNVIRQHGGIPIEKKTTKKVVDSYMNNLHIPDKYHGFMLDHETTYNEAKKNGLVLTADNFGHNEIAFPVSKRNNRLLDMINETIVYLQDNGEMKKICNKHLDPENAGFCDI